MSTARVSVLIPAWNAADTLPACLRSIQRQSYEDFECLVVDDGSQDDSASIVEDFAARDSRIRLIRREHAGIVASLNAGLEDCRGSLVARMDADDWMRRRRIEAQVACLDEHPSWAGVGCHVRFFPREETGPGLRDYEAWLNQIRTPGDVRRAAFIECPLGHPTWMMRSEVIKALGYRNPGWAEDYDLLLRALAAKHELGVVPERLHAWRNHSRRLVWNDANYAIERFVACKAQFLAEGFLAEQDRFVLWGFGGTGRALRKALLAHHKSPAYIVELHPGRLGEVIHGAPVIPPKSLVDVPRLPVVVSVAGETAREDIRQDLAAMDFEELRDFVFAA